MKGNISMDPYVFSLISNKFENLDEINNVLEKYNVKTYSRRNKNLNIPE